MERFMHWTKEKPSLGGLIHWRIAIMFKMYDEVICIDGCPTLWTNRQYGVAEVLGSFIALAGIQGWFAANRFKLKEKVVPEQIKKEVSAKIPHKHAALIKAWADGAKIEYNFDGRWIEITSNPGWLEGYQYRIKPEKVKKELWVIVKMNKTTGEIYTSGSYSSFDTANKWCKQGGNAQIQYLCVQKVEFEIEV